MLLLDLELNNKNENENKKKTLQAVIAIKEKVGTLKNNNYSSGKNRQPGRIFETVNSDNNNNLTRRSHRRVFFFQGPEISRTVTPDAATVRPQ